MSVNRKETNPTPLPSIDPEVAEAVAEAIRTTTSGEEAAAAAAVVEACAEESDRVKASKTSTSVVEAGPSGLGAARKPLAMVERHNMTLRSANGQLRIIVRPDEAPETHTSSGESEESSSNVSRRGGSRGAARGGDINVASTRASANTSSASAPTVSVAPSSYRDAAISIQPTVSQGTNVQGGNVWYTRFARVNPITTSGGVNTYVPLVTTTAHESSGGTRPMGPHVAPVGGNQRQDFQGPSATVHRPMPTGVTNPIGNHPEDYRLRHGDNVVDVLTAEWEELKRCIGVYSNAYFYVQRARFMPYLEHFQMRLQREVVFACHSGMWDYNAFMRLSALRDSYEAWAYNSANLNEYQSRHM